MVGIKQNMRSAVAGSLARQNRWGAELSVWLFRAPDVYKVKEFQ